MAPLPRKLILVLLIILAAAVIALVSYSTDHDHQHANRLQLGRRRLKGEEGNDDGDTDFLMVMPKKKQLKKLVASSVSVGAKNKTKLVKPGGGIGFAKNKTTLLKAITGLSTKNKTKSVKSVPGEDEAASKGEKTIGLTKIKIKKLNSTTSKASNSTKSNSALLSKKSADLIKTPGGINAENKTTKSTKTTSQKTNADPQSKPEKITKAAIKTTSTTTKNKQQPQSPQKKPIQTSAIAAKNSDKDDDFISDLADLPVKFQQSIVPDLHLISARANKHITTTFKPYMTPSHASTLSTALLSLTLILILLPLLLVLLLARCFKLASSSSLLKLLAFVHTYLAIYFSVLSLSSLATGLEPLRFFHSTSKSTYLCVQVMQTLGYLMYLLVNIVYLVFVLGTENGLGSRFLGLAQTFVGFAVGVHYYVTVFHRVLMRQPPRTNWKVHGVYAMSFLVVCLFAAADRRKKAYLADGGQEGKNN